MFEIQSENSLPSKCLTQYKGFAYDGCWFYLTVYCERRVVQLDPYFQKKQCFDTCRCYTCICYDPKEECFWASDDQCMSTIFKLNECFEEIDSIYIHSPDVCGGLITGISYNCCDDTLLVSFVGGVLRVCKQHSEDSVTLMKCGQEWILGVVSIYPYFLCYSVSVQKKTVRIYSYSGNLIKEVSIPCELVIESAIFFPCVKNCSQCHFYVLISKHGCYSYIYDVIMECDALCEKISCCNYGICDKNCHCNEHKECCSDVLESIALVEASIANILNAEGEKLQKAISSTDDICKILEVNKSVNKTIVKATHLENLLYDKLDALNDCCDFCENSKSCVEDCCNQPREVCPCEVNWENLF